jgi:hypothetical protein
VLNTGDSQLAALSGIFALGIPGASGVTLTNQDGSSIPGWMSATFAGGAGVFTMNDAYVLQSATKYNGTAMFPNAPPNPATFYIGYGNNQMTTISVSYALLDTGCTSPYDAATNTTTVSIFRSGADKVFSASIEGFRLQSAGDVTAPAPWSPDVNPWGIPDVVDAAAGLGADLGLTGRTSPLTLTEKGPAVGPVSVVEWEFGKSDPTSDSPDIETVACTS